MNTEYESASGLDRFNVGGRERGRQVQRWRHEGMYIHTVFIISNLSIIAGQTLPSCFRQSSTYYLSEWMKDVSHRPVSESEPGLEPSPPLGGECDPSLRINACWADFAAFV